MKESTTTTNTSSPKIELSDFIENEPPEIVEAKAMARRYRLPYIDLLPTDAESPIDYEQLAAVPVEMMLKNHFVPLKREGRDLHAAMADPTNLERLNELEKRAERSHRSVHCDAGCDRLVLKKGDATQRVLQEAASGFKISLVKETDQGDEVLDLDRLASDSEMSPIIKLVDTIVYNAMESRASDIHIEAGDRDVRVKFRIDGLFMRRLTHRYCLPPDSDLAYQGNVRARHCGTPDTADGRFRVRYKGRTVDFRVSILPSAFGENCVIRILDKEQISEEFKNLSLEVVGFDAGDLSRFRLYIKEPTEWCL
jgi:type IV pilus assembly protein PilB